MKERRDADTGKGKGIITEEHLFIHAMNVSVAMGTTDMEVSGFMKKFKDKKFAAKCDCEVIKKDCEMLGMEVRDVSAVCIEAV